MCWGVAGKFILKVAAHKVSTSTDEYAPPPPALLSFQNSFCHSNLYHLKKLRVLLCGLEHVPEAICDI